MTTLFHVTSVRNRQSIWRHGLDWRRMGAAPGIANSPRAEAEGVFLARDEQEADWFAGFPDARSGHVAVDIWAVEFDEDFNPSRPPAHLPFGDAGTSFIFYAGRISPELLRLHKRDLPPRPSV